MKTASFDNYLFRCSALGKLMTNPRNKKDSLSATTKRYLQEIHKEVLFGKSTEIQSKYLDKGKQVEDDSIAMYNRVTGHNTKKNDEFFTNDYICGTPDIIGDRLIDIKSSWDYTTFPMYEELLPSKDYYWQLLGYMVLTSKKESWLAYCLVDTPTQLIQDEVRRLGWKLGMIEVPMDLEAEVYERLQYADIPEELRIKKFHIEYNDEDVQRLYERIEICREYLTDLSVGLGERIINTLI
jgi:hypothetical protein